MNPLSINDQKLADLLENDNLNKKCLFDNQWLRDALQRAGDPPNKDFFGQWTNSVGTAMPDPATMQEISYLFYFDEKYHWIVKHPNGQDQVVDPELWASFFHVEKMLDQRCYYLDTEVVDQFYGSLRLTIEFDYRSIPYKANLVAPDGNLIKDDIKRFHITRTELI